MQAPLIDGFLGASSDRRRGFWRVALSGLTPQVIAIVAALLFIRILSANVEMMVAAAGSRQLGEWLGDSVMGYVDLLIMATPMLIVRNGKKQK